jgi:phenylacetate-CoA ligase
VHRLLCERTLYLDTLDLTDERMLAFAERIRARKPRILFGHAHSIYFLAAFFRSKGVDDIRFKGIISTAETLVPEERQVVEAVFGPVVFDRYGSEEVSLIASECPSHEGLHVAAENLYVEILDDGGTEPGRVVVTDLVNTAMPLVRYEIGDLATWRTGQCPCGRGLPRLGRVYGRVTDFLYAPDGRRISGVSILDTFMIHIPGIKQAQIVQEELDAITIRVLPDSRFDDATRARLDRTVADVFGVAMRHRVELVDAIPRTPRGKFQFTICRVPDAGPRRNP